MTAQIKKFGVMGNPIAHSKSPQIHEKFGKQTGCLLTYDRILVPLDTFKEAVIDFFINQKGSGLNITVPFKEQAYQLCDVLSERAKVAKAVNTLWFDNGKIMGDNTDGKGLVTDLQQLHIPLVGKNILILGAGGATRGVILPLFEAGVASITIANRTKQKAIDLVADVQCFLTPEQHLSAIGLDEMTGQFDVVINATSASLGQDTLLLSEQLCFDYGYEMAYGKPSNFIAECQKRQVPVYEGKGMLIGQASESFFLWNGVRPDIKTLDFSEIFQ